MELILFFVGLVVTVYILITLLKLTLGQGMPKSANVLSYHYARKSHIMTNAEGEFFSVLKKIVEPEFAIYPQVHLNAFLDHQVRGQDWRAALSLIQRKSVDYLVCNIGDNSPVLAIELDDASHLRADRRARDGKIEAIFNDAGMPLIRIPWQSKYDHERIKSTLEPYLRDKDLRV